MKRTAPPSKPAVEPLIELAQVGARQRIVLNRGPFLEQAIPKNGPLGGVGIFALGMGIPPGEFGQRRARYGRRSTDSITRPALVQPSKSRQDGWVIRLVGKSLHGRMITPLSKLEKPRSYGRRLSSPNPRRHRKVSASHAEKRRSVATDVSHNRDGLPNCP